jgi:hypothetical protein
MTSTLKQIICLTLLLILLAVPSAFSASFYLVDTGDGHHFAWSDQNPATPQIDVYYDFRLIGDGTPNGITPHQQSVVAQALGLWSGASNLGFIRNEAAPLESIINIGVGAIDGPRQTIGSGGASFYRNDALGVRRISRGFVLLDVENWDLSIGNGNPSGTVDFFTVAAHEIGHVLGLGHTDGLPGVDVMDSVYGGELIGLSNNDRSLIQTLYGAPLGAGQPGVGQALPVTQQASLVMAPEPSTVAMLASGMIAMGIRWVCRRRAAPAAERL